MFPLKNSPSFSPSQLKGFSAVHLSAFERRACLSGLSVDSAKPLLSVLYARSDSVYKKLPVCDVFDLARDARTFSGSTPVIAHPPCRLWGRLRTFSTAPESEKELAFHAVDCVRRNGGILEHPASSKLWPAAGLPLPGVRDSFGGFTLPVLQSWWGHKAPKATWLYIVGLEPRDLPAIPFELGAPSGRIENFCTKQREATPEALALWLVDLALEVGFRMYGTCNYRTFVSI